MTAITEAGRVLPTSLFSGWGDGPCVPATAAADGDAGGRVGEDPVVNVWGGLLSALAVLVERRWLWMARRCIPAASSESDPALAGVKSMELPSSFNPHRCAELAAMVCAVASTSDEPIESAGAPGDRPSASCCSAETTSTDLRGAVATPRLGAPGWLWGLSFVGCIGG